MRLDITDDTLVTVRQDDWYEDLSCWVDSCVHCGAPDLHRLTDEEISWDSRGDARCPECGGSRCVYSTSVCCAAEVAR